MFFFDTTQWNQFRNKLQQKRALGNWKWWFKSLYVWRKIRHVNSEIIRYFYCMRGKIFCMIDITGKSLVIHIQIIYLHVLEPEHYYKYVFWIKKVKYYCCSLEQNWGSCSDLDNRYHALQALIRIYYWIKSNATAINECESAFSMHS